MKNLILALPYLHRELYSLSPEISSLWVGLPGQPQHTWQPNFPGSPEYAASLLSYFERLTIDGASGSSVLSMESMPLSELSQSEQSAIRNFSGVKEYPIQPLKTVAWQILILCWLKEKQVMELSELERKISASGQQLSSILQDTKETTADNFYINEYDLPNWKDLLFAFLAFLPDLPDNTELFIQSASMSEAVNSFLLEKKSTQIAARELVSLCSRYHKDKLIGNITDSDLEKLFTIRCSIGA